MINLEKNIEEETGISTISCVKGYVEEMKINGAGVIAGFQKYGPSPMNASCFSCQGVVGSIEFLSCMNPNETSSVRVGVDVCELGVKNCLSIIGYDNSGGIQSVQRSCGNNESVNNEFLESCINGTEVICTSKCPVDENPCNDYLVTMKHIQNQDEKSSAKTFESNFFVILGIIILSK